VTDDIIKGPYPEENASPFDRSKVDKWTIILRRAHPTYNKAMEFRVFIKDNQFIGICQKDDTIVFEILDEKLKEAVFESVSTYCEESLIPAFKDYADSFIADLYIDMPSSGYKPWVLDIDPFLPGLVYTGLFEWQDLIQIKTEGEFVPEFRTFDKESHGHIKPRKNVEHAYPTELNNMEELEEIMRL
jgi:hypothetical protein